MDMFIINIFFPKKMCLYIVNHIDFCGSVLLDLGKIKTYLIGYSNLYESSQPRYKVLMSLRVITSVSIIRKLSTALNLR